MRGQWEIMPQPRLDLSKEDTSNFFVGIADTYESGVTNISVCVIKKSKEDPEGRIVEVCNYYGRPSKAEFYKEIEILLSHYKDCNILVEDEEIMKAYKIKMSQPIDWNSEKAQEFRQYINRPEFKDRMKQEFDEWIAGGMKRAPIKLIT